MNSIQSKPLTTPTADEVRLMEAQMQLRLVLMRKAESKRLSR